MTPVKNTFLFRYRSICTLLLDTSGSKHKIEQTNIHLGFIKLIIKEQHQCGHELLTDINGIVRAEYKHDDYSG